MLIAVCVLSSGKTYGQGCTFAWGTLRTRLGGETERAGEKIGRVRSITVYCMTLGYTGLHALSYTGLHWVTLSYTELHWVTLSYTGSHWVTRKCQYRTNHAWSAFAKMNIAQSMA